MNLLSLILILAGALFIFAAAVGIVRFGDTMSRVHAVTKPQTIGLVLCLTGAIVKIVSSPDFGVSQKSDIGMVVLLVLFALMTSPVTAHRISRLARREGLYAKNMSRNDRPAGKLMRGKK